MNTYNSINYNEKEYSPIVKEDEKGAGGLWDLAADVAVSIGIEAKGLGLISDNEVVWPEDFGQEIIYGVVKQIAEKRNHSDKVGGTVTTYCNPTTER